MIADSVHLIDPFSIDNSGLYNITIAGLCKEMRYFSNLTLRNSNGLEIDATSVNFSRCHFLHYKYCQFYNVGFTLCVATYSVQNLVAFPSNKTAVVTVQCFFAVNAPAHGCLVVFWNLPFTVLDTIYRSKNTTKAEKDVAIPKTLLSNVSYVLLDVEAYDYYINQTIRLSNPAVALYDQVTLTISPSMSTTPSQSTEAVSSTPTCMLYIVHVYSVQYLALSS